MQKWLHPFFERKNPMTTHPLAFIPDNQRKRVFFIFLAGTLFIMATFRFVLDPPLQTEAAPQGIVSFELAGSQLKADEIIASWDDTARLYAAFGLGFDFLFMPVYAAAIALGVLLSAGRHPGRFATVGVWVGWGAFVATIFDAAENTCLFNLLLGNSGPNFAGMAALYAALKFGLILLGIVYALVGWMMPKAK
jgi:hypothetical protein